MAQPTSPLRYPGGKTSLLELISTILRMNNLERRHYVEPFAGGCGLALALLYGGHVADIHINDIDPSIWAFWHSVLNNTDRLIEKIYTTPVTVEEWRIQRDTHRIGDTADHLSLGFSAFFLNRTNRSGIISGAGMIGGVAQNGNYKIDCRYNADDLARRVRRIAKYKDRIHLSNLDARDFIEKTSKNLDKSAFFCIDPPYYHKGSDLYTNSYVHFDHAFLADDVISLDRPWIVTYDDTPEIRLMYKDRRQFCFDLNYSIQTKRVGTELLIASKGLRIPPALRQRQVKKSGDGSVNVRLPTSTLAAQADAVSACG